MPISTLSAGFLPSPLPQPLRELVEELLPLVREVGQAIERFRNQEVTPVRACQFERELLRQLRQAGRRIVQWVYNHLEPDMMDHLPAQICWEGTCYRRRPKSPNRSLSSLFGSIRLWRYRYEPLEPGERSLLPLELRLGIEAERATAALAERVGQCAVSCTQQQVLALLQRDYGVCWGVKTLRKVTQSLSAGMTAFREAAQVGKLVDWLQQAAASSGPHRPVLSVGRDGVMLPVRGEAEYREGAAATASVLDRRGRRLGTVYLGQMPEAKQKRLSAQLTSLIVGVLGLWTGMQPLLQYVTDAGSGPAQYFKKVLKKLPDPRRPGRWLRWFWVVDYYHTCTYLTKLAEGLFRCDRARQGWARKMRHWLKHKGHGVYRILHSAAALRFRSRRTWRWEEKKAYRQGHDYLKKYGKFMDYASYRRKGLAIGSGVTEAACKTVFTQRLKQSGMTWYLEGGQVIVDLRVLWLSGVWDEVHGSYLASKTFPDYGTQLGVPETTTRKAA